MALLIIIALLAAFAVAGVLVFLEAMRMLALGLAMIVLLALVGI